MSVLRKTAGTALAGGAQVLSVASKLMEATAKTLRPSPPSPREEDSRREAVATPPKDASSTADVVEAVEEQVPDRGRIVQPPGTPLLDDTPHVRTSESHIEELAAQNASDVIAAVSDLSTDELRLLTEYEMAHKNRTTVLAAIEKAFAPDSSATPGSNGSGSRSGSGRGGGSGRNRGQQREIVMPEAGGVPTSGTMDRSKRR